MDKIGLHNYEEYFLLYIDGELDEAGCRIVEEYISAHEAMREEFESLKETMLPPQIDNLTIDKTSLYRNEAEPKEVQVDSLDEKILMYLDKELNQKESLEFEALLQQNPLLSNAVFILKQTKLALEAIPHPNKKELYRRKKTILFAIPRSYTAIASIAALFVLVPSLWLILPRQTSPTKGLANNEIGNAPQKDNLMTGLENKIQKMVLDTIKDYTQKDNSPDESGDAPYGKPNEQMGKMVNFNPRSANAIKVNAQLNHQQSKDCITDPGYYQNNNTFAKEAQYSQKNLTCKEGMVLMTQLIDDENKSNALSERRNYSTGTKHEASQSFALDDASNQGDAQVKGYRYISNDTQKKGVRLGFINLNTDKLRGVSRKIEVMLKGSYRLQNEASDLHYALNDY